MSAPVTGRPSGPVGLGSQFLESPPSRSFVLAWFSGFSRRPSSRPPAPTSTPADAACRRAGLRGPSSSPPRSSDVARLQLCRFVLPAEGRSVDFAADPRHFCPPSVSGTLQPPVILGFAPSLGERQFARLLTPSLFGNVSVIVIGL